jgi:hypothetical protein
MRRSRDRLIGQPRWHKRHPLTMIFAAKTWLIFQLGMDQLQLVCRQGQWGRHLPTGAMEKMVRIRCI